MKRILITAFVTGLVFSATVGQATLSLDISAYPSSQIVFYGSSSQFNLTASSEGDQWWITGGGTGAASGLFGDFFGGPWNYGGITVNGNDQSAMVTSPNSTLQINDGSGHLLTGTVNWVEVSTSSYVGGVNAAATVNITGLAYSGANVDLLALVNDYSGLGSADLSFQFDPGETLTQLTTGAGPYGSSYSGTLTAIPETSTMVAGILLLLPFGASTLRALRKSRTA